MAKKKAPVEVEVNPEPHIQLIASDGTQFVIPERAAVYSTLIQSQLKDDRDEGDEANNHIVKSIELPQVRATILDIICKYCMARSDPELEDRPLLEFNPLKQLNCAESESDRQLLLELLLASKYMGCDI